VGHRSRGDGAWDDASGQSFRVEAKGWTPRPEEPMADSQSISEHNFGLRVRKAVAPPYDDRLYFTRAQGTVRIIATVSPSGEIEDAAVKETFWTWNNTMNEYFLTFARKWLFEPFDSPRTVEIVFEFRLLPRETSDHDLGTVFVAPARVEINGREPPPLTFHRPGAAQLDPR